MVANVIGVKKPLCMEMDQHRTGHRWIEKCNMNVVSAIRERDSAGQVMLPEWTAKKSVRRP